MSDENLMIVSSVSGALAVIATIIGVINHKRIRSNCCGRKAELSFDIDNTLPVNNPVGSHTAVDAVK